VEKPAKDLFDPRIFLAKVGTGKQVLEFHKNQHVFEQGDVADTVFYIQSGKVKLTVVSEQGKEAVVAILEPGQFFGRMHEWSSVTHRDDNGDGRLRHHVDHERRDDHGYS
jgi:CRP-like cAMP-binding protein